MSESQICQKCGIPRPIEQFQLMKPKDSKPYRLKTCNKCRHVRKVELKNKLSDDIELLTTRQYKIIPPQRILDVQRYGIDLKEEDEIFVRMIEYKDVWISNYGRAVKKNGNSYNLLKGKIDKWGHLSYAVKKEIYKNGKWMYYKTTLAADHAVMNEFVINPDIRNNVKCWHLGGNVSDNYYKHLYPLNQSQNRVVRANLSKTGEDSEEFILKVMNDVLFKPDDWGKCYYDLRICGIGYVGSASANIHSIAYQKWKDMLYRCYSGRYKDYEGCTVCEEWHNYSNFEIWFNSHLQGNDSVDLDKDILYKGNKLYSAETCCLVPHCINTLFLACNSNRGNLPIGVWYDKEKSRYRANLSYNGESQKLGSFKTVEEAFKRFKDYKENLIKEVDEKYEGKIRKCVHDAMINWEIEITD